jgi:hypothetical protein
MRSVIITAILFIAALAGSPAQAEGTGVWAAYAYDTPQGSDSRILRPESRSEPTRAVLAWWDGPHSAIVAADAGFGTVNASALVSSAEGGIVNHYINSGFADEITLSRPDLLGQPGRITISFHYEGRMTVFAGEGAQLSVGTSLLGYVNDASGSVSEDINAGDFSGHVKRTYLNDVNGIRQWDTPFEDRYLTMTADFVWGEPVRFGYTAWTSGYAAGFGGHEAALSAQWAGILEASAGGTAISDYSLSSLTGTDYTRSFVSAVPEPRSFMLLASGLCLLAWRLAGLSLSSRSSSAARSRSGGPSARARWCRPAAGSTRPAW